LGGGLGPVWHVARLVLSALLALLTALLIEKHDGYFAAMTEPTPTPTPTQSPMGSPTRDLRDAVPDAEPDAEQMDVDCDNAATSPWGGLPLPGKLIDGVRREVVHHDM